MPIIGLIVICTNLKLLIIILLYKELHSISSVKNFVILDFYGTFIRYASIAR